MNHRHTVGLLGRVISSSQGLYLHRTTQHRQTRTNIHALGGIRTRDPVYERSRSAPQTTRPLVRKPTFYEIRVLRVHACVWKRERTWFPKTPIEQAVDTSLGPNQIADRLGETLNMNYWDTSTSVWPMNVTQNRSGLTDIVFTHAPAAVPVVPRMMGHLKPYTIDRCVILVRLHSLLWILDDGTV
jgi:hypothetical protein